VKENIIGLQIAMHYIMFV
jgi:hypothetical protein